MSLRFLSDQCVPAEISNHLRRAGYQVTLLREVLPIRALDPAVMAKARELGAILLSLNGDFSDIVAYPPAAHLGIVAIQLNNHPEIIPQVMERLPAKAHFRTTHIPVQSFCQDCLRMLKRPLQVVGEN